jgi:hypothetical protein
VGAESLMILIGCAARSRGTAHRLSEKSAAFYANHFFFKLCMYATTALISSLLSFSENPFMSRPFPFVTALISASSSRVSKNLGSAKVAILSYLRVVYMDAASGFSVGARMQASGLLRGGRTSRLANEILWSVKSANAQPAAGAISGLGSGHPT